MKALENGLYDDLKPQERQITRSETPKQVHAKQPVNEEKLSAVHQKIVFQEEKIVENPERMEDESDGLSLKNKEIILVGEFDPYSKLEIIDILKKHGAKV